MESPRFSHGKAETRGRNKVVESPRSSHGKAEGRGTSDRYQIRKVLEIGRHTARAVNPTDLAQQRVARDGLKARSEPLATGKKKDSTNLFPYAETETGSGSGSGLH